MEGIACSQKRQQVMLERSDIKSLDRVYLFVAALINKSTRNERTSFLTTIKTSNDGFVCDLTGEEGQHRRTDKAM